MQLSTSQTPITDSRLIWIPDISTLIRQPLDGTISQRRGERDELARVARFMDRHPQTGVTFIGPDTAARNPRPAAVFSQRHGAISVILPEDWHLNIMGPQSMADAITVMSLVEPGRHASSGTIITRPGIIPDIVRGTPHIATPEARHDDVNADIAALSTLMVAMRHIMGFPGFY